MYEVYLVGHELSHCIDIHVITYYKVVSAITLLLHNSYLWSLRISVKDVMKVNSKLCTIFLLESILYTLNFSLMEDSLLYVANINFIIQSLRNLINPKRARAGSLTMAMTVFSSFCPSIISSALCSVFLSQFQSLSHQHKHILLPSVQPHYHIHRSPYCNSWVVSWVSAN